MISSKMLALLQVLLLGSFLFNQPHKAEAAKKGGIDTKKYAHICVKSTKGYATLKDNDARGHAILKLAFEVSGLTNLIAKDTPQHKAMCWMIYDDPKKLDPRSGGRGRFLDRYALVTLYMNTKGPGWVRSDHWLSKDSECYWYGITCARPSAMSVSYRVTGIDLSFNKVAGLIPRELAYMSELRELDLNGNELQGVVPNLMMASLTKLEKLHLHMNDLFGSIPTEIGKLKNLQELTLFGNFFFGKVPTEIANLKYLQVLDIYANNLTGSIPSEIGKMKNLREIFMNDNEFVGRMPKEICALKPQALAADCMAPKPEVSCECCTLCCKGLPDPKCKDMRAVAKTKKK